MRRHSLVCACVFVLYLAVAVFAGPVALGVVLSTPSNYTNAPSVGIDASGRAYTAWLPNISRPAAPEVSTGAWHAAAGAWNGFEVWGTNQAVPLGATSAASAGAGVPVSIGVSNTGNVVLAWQDHPPTTSQARVRAFVKSAQANVTPAALVLGTCAGGIDHIHAAISDGGRAGVTWDCAAGGGVYSVWAAMINGAASSPAVKISGSGACPGAGAVPSIGVDAPGDLALIWLQHTPSAASDIICDSITKPTSNTFSPAAILARNATPFGSTSDTSLSVRPSGVIVATWDVACGSGANCVTAVGAATGNTVQGFQPPTVVSTGSNVTSLAPRAVANWSPATGFDAAVVWPASGPNSSYNLVASFHATNGAWSIPNQVATLDSSGPDDFQVALNNNKLWVAFLNHNTVMLTSGGPTGAFSTPVAVSGDKASKPALTTNGNGQFALAWTGSGGPQPEVHAYGCRTGAANCP